MTLFSILDNIEKIQENFILNTWKFYFEAN